MTSSMANLTFQKFTAFVFFFFFLSNKCICLILIVIFFSISNYHFIISNHHYLLLFSLIYSYENYGLEIEIIYFSKS